MRSNMKKLLEQALLKEKDFKGDDGVSLVPDPEFSGALPPTDLPQEGEGKSKEAKNADFKGKKKDEPKKLSEEEIPELTAEEIEKLALEQYGEAENPWLKELDEKFKHEQTSTDADLRAKLKTITAKISYYQNNSKAGEKKGVAPSAELESLKKQEEQIKKQLYGERVKGAPRTLNNSYEVDASKVNVEEDLNALFGEDDLTPEFKERVKAIYEAAIITKANEVINVAVAEAREVLEKATAELTEQLATDKAEFEAKLVEDFDAKVDEMSVTMEAVTEKAIEEWKEENKVAIQSATKVAIAESFMATMKELFETHNVEVATDKVDVTESLMAEVDELTKKLEEEVAANVAMRQALEESKRKEILDEISEGLTQVEKDKFKLLSENTDFASEEDYSTKLTAIKESFFSKKKEQVIIKEEDQPLNLEEEVVPSRAVDPIVAATVSALTRYGKK